MAISCLLVGCQPDRAREESVQLPEIGLFGTIPIYWGDSGDISDILADGGKPDWIRAELEQRFTLVPLDALESDILLGHQRLLLVQPRPLAPSENVALDRWVRAGGQALVFADPLLTRSSPYPIGDRRRPQDTILLSPILTRWGLELYFREEQSEAERWIDDGTVRLPVRLAGEFMILPGAKAARCMLTGARTIAFCRIGKGRVTLVADAAVLDGEGDGSVSRERKNAFDAILSRSFDP